MIPDCAVVSCNFARGGNFVGNNTMCQVEPSRYSSLVCHGISKEATLHDDADFKLFDVERTCKLKSECISITPHVWGDFQTYESSVI